MARSPAAGRTARVTIRSPRTAAPSASAAAGSVEGGEQAGRDLGLDHRRRGHGRPDLLGHEHEVGQSGAPPTARLRHGHLDDADAPQRVPQDGVEARRLGGADPLGGGVLRQQVGERRDERLLLVAEREIHLAAASQPSRHLRKPRANRPQVRVILRSVPMTTRSASPFIDDLAPITESDDELRAILAEAELPPLLPSLAYATGDLSLLRDDLRPDPLLYMLPNAGLEGEQAATIRELALGALVAFRDGGCRTAPVPPDEVVLRLMEFAVGSDGLAAYLPLIEEELGHGGEDRRAPTWHVDDVSPGEPFRVAVIGAGMSGLLTAHRLQQAGVDHVVFEKDDDVGGTWYENRYPGCRVDNPNHTYSYSFAQRHDWPFHFSTQPVLQQYLRRLRRRLRPAGADPVRHRGRVRGLVGRGPALDGDRARPPTAARRRTSSTRWSARSGQLNRPKLPTTIPGFGTFEGPAFHSARWDPDVDLTGKRVAVIGTGASAMQLIPEIAPLAGELLVFQRTPAWLGAHARLPRAGAGRHDVALRPPALATRSGTASASSGGSATVPSPA